MTDHEYHIIQHDGLAMTFMPASSGDYWQGYLQFELDGNKYEIRMRKDGWASLWVWSDSVGMTCKGSENNVTDLIKRNL